MKSLTTVGILVQAQGKILCLLRAKHKSQGGKWGLPAGKVEEGESYLEAAKRELAEETTLQKNPQMLGVWKWMFPDIHITFPVFQIKYEHLPSISLPEDAHERYAWLSPEEILSLPNAIHGLKNLIRIVYHNKNPCDLDEHIEVVR